MYKWNMLKTLNITSLPARMPILEMSDFMLRCSTYSSTFTVSIGIKFSSKVKYFHVAGSFH